MDGFVCCSSPELSINGELNSAAIKGFSRIVIHFKADYHIEVDSRETVVREGQTETRHTGEDLLAVGGCSFVIIITSTFTLKGTTDVTSE